MRLIDGDALIERIESETRHYVVRDKFDKGRIAGWNNIIKAVRDYIQTVDAVPVCVLKEILMRYFDIGDSYHFELTRVKEAFEVGTMSLDDFQEWTEENVDDLVDYIKKNCADGERKGG